MLWIKTFYLNTIATIFKVFLRNRTIKNYSIAKKLRINSEISLLLNSFFRFFWKISPKSAFRTALKNYLMECVIFVNWKDHRGPISQKKKFLIIYIYIIYIHIYTYIYKYIKKNITFETVLFRKFVPSETFQRQLLQ